MFRPFRTYRLMREEQPPVSWWAALERPLFTAIVLGTSVGIWATNHVTVRLVLSMMVCWSFAIALQLAAALVLIVPARRRLPVASAVDLFFASHGPWSLWFLGSVVWVLLSSPLGRPAQFHIETSLLPAAWTALLVFAFCRGVLECGRREAFFRLVLHQSIIWSVAIVLFALAVQLVPRLEAVLR